MSLPLLDRLQLKADVDDIVLRWARTNLVKIVKAYAQKGGWEGWAQVEIATVLRDQLVGACATFNPPVAVTVSREVAVYLNPDSGKSPMLADVVVEFNQQGVTDCIIIELKCESAYNTSPIAQRVRADVVKLERQIRARYGHALRWAMAFSGSDAGRAGLRTIDMSTSATGAPAAGDQTIRREPKLLYPVVGHGQQGLTGDEMNLLGNPHHALTEVELALNPIIAFWWLEEERAGEDQYLINYRQTVTPAQAVADGTYNDFFYRTPDGHHVRR